MMHNETRMASSFLRFSKLVFIFCSWRHLQDRWADLQIFEEGGKWAATEKLSFWFLSSFGGGREVQKGHFRFRSSFIKHNMAAKRFYLSKKTGLILGN